MRSPSPFFFLTGHNRFKSDLFKRVCAHLSFNFLRNMWLTCERPKSKNIAATLNASLGVGVNDKMAAKVDTAVWINVSLVCRTTSHHAFLGRRNDQNYTKYIFFWIAQQDFKGVKALILSPFPLAVEWCCWCQRQRSCHGDGRHGGILRGRLMAKWSRASGTVKNQTGQVAEKDEKKDRNYYKIHIRGLIRYLLLIC